MNKNIFGEPLITCSSKPLTGYFRNGCCDTDNTDIGMHTVCIIANHNFLLFSKEAGNDLTTPIPEYGFDGLKDGEKWCLCALRWKEALINNIAPKVILEAAASGTPQVVTDVGSCNLVSTKSIGKVVSVGNKLGISNAISDLIDDPLAWRDASLNGPKMASTYSWKHTSNIIEQSYLKELAS